MAAETRSLNRFAPPGAVVGDIATGVQPVRLWPPRGRIGRLRFLAYGIGLWLLASLFAFFFGMGAGLAGAPPELVSAVVGVLYVAVAALIVIQRSHDMNLSGWASLLTVIPFVGLVWLCKRGSTGDNRFGAPPPPNSTLVIVAGWVAAVLMALAAIGIIAAIAIPATIGLGGRS